MTLCLGIGDLSACVEFQFHAQLIDDEHTTATVVVAVL